LPIAPNATPLPPLTGTANPNLTPLPPVGVPAAPPSRISLADAIEVTGIVQVKGKWNVIVKEPGSSTSRYVKTGDYLANGQVLVKRILSGADPIVVLQQNGVEVIKSLGSSGGAIAIR
jgi:multidrug efflux pump subunit AcrA (membrane-fusion protein)